MNRTRAAGRTGARTVVLLTFGGLGIAGVGELVSSPSASGLRETPTLARAAPPAGTVPLHPGHFAFPDGPPARVTGGFGEESCFGCHWDGTENDGAGSLRVQGFPDRYEPGHTYPLRVTLARDGMEVAGFQLAVRQASDTTQAGAFALLDRGGPRVSILEERGIQFAQHHLEGIAPLEAGRTEWILHWTAPDRDARLLLHASAVAGDGDQSQMGDHVYTIEVVSEPATGEGL